jgi:hypothetical protein
MDNAIEGDEDLLWADGLLHAVIGIATRADGLRVVCYSIEKIIEIFMTRDGMTEEEAYEFYEFNVACAWVGDKTPIFVETVKES